MREYTLFYQSENDDCTGKYSGKYDSLEAALHDLSAKVLDLSSDAEILCVGVSDLLHMELM